MDHPTFTYFECLVVSIGSNAHSTLVACVYRSPGSCSNPFYDEFYTLVEFLSSTNTSFIICGDFNIHIDTTSRDSVNFLNTLDSCNITQHVHSATHLHGHTLNLILTSDSSLVSNVVVSDYISDHAMIKCQVEIPTTAKSQANGVTYRRYHKINMDTLRNDLSNCSFVACLGDTAKKLYDQYTNDLSNLLDKLQRLLAILPRSQQSGYQIPTKMPNPFDDSLNASGVKRKLLLTMQGCANKLPGVIHLPIKKKPHITELLLMKTVITLKNFGKFCILPYTVSLTRFFLQIVHKKKLADRFATFSPIRLLKSESLFQFFILFLAISSESTRTCQI